MQDFLVEILKGIVSVLLYAWPIFVLLLFLFSWQNRRKVTYLENTEYTTIEIKIPKTNDKNPTSAEMMFATLHGILKPGTELMKEGALQEHISFEMVADGVAIRFFVWCPKHLKDFVEGQIYAQYPSAEIKEVEDYAHSIKPEDLGKTYQAGAAEINLTKSDYLPVKTFINFTVDPLAGITGVLSKLDQPGENIWIQILARPVADEWKRPGLNWVADMRGRSKTTSFSFSLSKIIGGIVKFAADVVKAIFVNPAEAGDKGENKNQLSSEEESMIMAVEQKADKLAYAVKIRVLYIADDSDKTQERLHAIFGAFKQFNTTTLNGFQGKSLSANKNFVADYQNRIFLSDGYHLNIEELASIYHLPHTSVETPNITWTSFKTSEPPTNVPTVLNTDPKDIAVFAETNFRSQIQEFGIKRDDRRRHMYVIGKSGMGKSKLLELLAGDDIVKGEGVAIIDPHGDTINEVITRIPEHRIEDVIIFDPADTKFPIAFNPMEVTDPELKVQIAAGVLGSFKKIFGTSWGPRLEYIFNYTLLALLDMEEATLIDVVQMLTDKDFRRDVIAKIKDPVVKKFWTTEYASYNDKFATEAIAPILNKVGQFVANSLIRNIIGQPKSSFNLRKSMDEGKIMLFNLSVGRIGETNAALLGSFLINSLQIAAMSRADIAEDDRKDFYLYVDEFQNFATESFATILSEARKYRLSLIMANQYVAQMEDVVREAVFGNVGTIISFRVGAQDAAVLAREFEPQFEAGDFINLARQNCYIRMTIEGQSEPAFSAKTLNVIKGDRDLLPTILAHSRHKYTKSLAEVEAMISGYANAEHLNNIVYPGSENNEQPKEKPETKASQKKPNTVAEAIKANTAHLSKPETTPKKPDQEKPTNKAEEAPVKIKDKIDKEILSDILKNVVTPKGESSTEKSDTKQSNKPTEEQKTGEEPSTKHEPKKENIKPQIKSESAIKPAPTQNNIIKNSDRRNISENNSENKETPNQKFESPSSREKVITPESFKELKAIHPHETVKIVSGNTSQAQDIKEGETIKFE